MFSLTSVFCISIFLQHFDDILRNFLINRLSTVNQVLVSSKNYRVHNSNPGLIATH